MKRIKPYVIALIFIIIIGLVVRGHLVEKNYEFNGLIQKITYEEPKHTPTIKVNGEYYTFVYNNRTLLDSVKVGDRVVKLEGENEIQVFSKKK